MVPWLDFWSFASILLAYLIGARLVGIYFTKSSFRESLISITGDFSRAEITAFVIFTLGLTAAVSTLGILFGASGDTRQYFGKEFRPLVLLHTGFFFISLLLLTSKNIRPIRALIWLVALMALAVPFSGKSIFLPLLYWSGIRYFASRSKIPLKRLITFLLLLFAGIAIMGVIAYKTDTFKGIILLIAKRLWLSGDVYIYAYKYGDLAKLHATYNVSFLPYIFHPLIALVGIHTYTAPLGAMLASEQLGHPVFTGPNPQLPVILDYFFPGLLLLKTFLGFVIGFLVIGLRPLSLHLSRIRARFIRIGGLAIAVIAPAAGFITNEQVQMYAIGIGAAAFFGLVIDLLFRRRPT